MRFKNFIFILALFMVLLCCFSAVNASENVDDSVSVSDDVAVDEVVSEVDSDDESISVQENEEIESSDDANNGSLEVSDVEEVDDADDSSSVLSAEENEDEVSGQTYHIIYVGKNITDDGGNGSYENPFSNLNLAFTDIDGSKDNVNIRLFSGNYSFDGELKVNASNIIIEGLNNDVVVKNLDQMNLQTISLVSPYSNCTINNMIFDASNTWTQTASMNFYPICGKNTNYCIFNNCTFIGSGLNNNFNAALTYAGFNYNSKFINCSFNGFKTLFRNLGTSVSNREILNVTFEYCIFSDINQLLSYYYIDKSTGESVTSIIFDRVLFDSNEIPSFFSLSRSNVKYYDNNARGVAMNLLPSKYAIFSVDNAYLRNGQFEIVGKLTWNGTKDQDGMENFQPMTIKLSSNTGNISETAILTNGTFKSIYASNSSEHKVVATLHNQPIELNFNSIDFTVEAPSIFYGEDQNITVTFPQVITNNITITVNNKTYDVEVNNSNSTTFTIEDRLTEGNYTVDVLYIDEVNKVYGSNSTILSVSRVSDYTFNPEINDNGDIKVGDELTITVELPIDVSGNVTVKVNDNPAITKEATPNTVITINNLVSGNNNITIAYTGNDKYVAKTTEPQVVTAQKVVIPEDEIRLVIENSSTPNVSIKLPEYVTGKLIVYVDGTPYAKELVNGSANITVPDQEPGKHNISAEFTGDEKYQGFKSDNTTFNVPKISVPGGENALNMTIPANSATPTYSINLPNATGNLTVIVDGKDKYTKELENGSATITLPELSAGKHEIIVTYSGDNKYENISKTTTVNVPAKSTPAKTPVAKKAATKITAKKKTFKAKKKVKKYTITLKSGKKPVKKVWVTLKIKGKKLLKAKTNAKGKATFKIKKLTKKGKYNAVIKFKGNKNYKASSKKVKITVKK